MGQCQTLGFINDAILFYGVFMGVLWGDLALFVQIFKYFLVIFPSNESNVEQLDNSWDHWQLDSKE